MRDGPKGGGGASKRFAALNARNAKAATAEAATAAGRPAAAAAAAAATAATGSTPYETPYERWCASYPTITVFWPEMAQQDLWRNT